MSSAPRATQPVEDFFATAQQVAFQPREFFARLPRRGDYAGPLLFFVICVEVSTFFGGLLKLASVPWRYGPAWQQAPETVGGWLAALVFAPLGATIGLFILAGIVHLLALLVLGAGNAGFEATFRVVAYTGVTNLVSWIPVVGPLVGLYGIYLAIVGLRELHGTTTGKAALVVLLPFLVLFALLWLAVMAALAAAFGFVIAGR
ncbi:MAG TPA: YIP1 family protein [Thermomicrobiales bacterium]|nr:YIP1 family protein [Thermomicrobiales bacterium]